MMMDKVPDFKNQFGVRWMKMLFEENQLTSDQLVSLISNVLFDYFFHFEFDCFQLHWADFIHLEDYLRAYHIPFLISDISLISSGLWSTCNLKFYILSCIVNAWNRFPTRHSKCMLLKVAFFTSFFFSFSFFLFFFFSFFLFFFFSFLCFISCHCYSKPGIQRSAP
jgi:hypothetical protein